MNPMNLMQMFQNPQQFMQNIMGNNQIMSNPMVRNIMNMAQRAKTFSSGHFFCRRLDKD